MSRNIRRRAFVAGTLALTLAPAVARADASYDLTTPTGTIAGTLDLPVDATKAPVVIVLPGSGPVDRDGNAGTSLRTDAYKLLGAALVASGIACVRFDKRGVAASRGALPDPSALTLGVYVDDTVAWLAKVRADGRFGKVALAGHSEGSLIGILAGQRARPDAFVSLEGPGRQLGALLRAQLGDRLIAAPALLAAAGHIMDELQAGRTVATVPAELMGLFAPVSQHYLISELDIDPALEIKKLRCPVTIVQGTYDAQVPVEDGKRLAAALPAARLVLVDRMSHVLKFATTAILADQVMTVYSDPALPIAPAVPAAVAAALV